MCITWLSGNTKGLIFVVINIRSTSWAYSSAGHGNDFALNRNIFPIGRLISQGQTSLAPQIYSSLVEKPFCSDDA